MDHQVNVLIVEDEPAPARRLKRLLARIGYPGAQIVNSVHEAVNLLKEKPTPDLILLDVQLGDGISFEIFEQIPDLRVPVIFSTAYDRYALRAFELNSIDYLLKPITDEKLVKALKKFRRHKQKHALTASEISALKTVLTGQKNTFKKRFSVKIGSSIKLFTTEEINCFYSENKGSFLVARKRPYPIDESLLTLEKKLDPKRFFRINRQLIVNIEAIKGIVSYSNSRLKVELPLIDRIELLIVSRERVNAFKQWLEGR